MKITRIDTVRVEAHPNLLWVEIHTDDGLVGLGETFYVPGAVASVIHDVAAQHLISTISTRASATRSTASRWSCSTRFACARTSTTNRWSCTTN